MTVLDRPAVARFCSVQMAVLPTAEVLAGYPDPWVWLTASEHERAHRLVDPGDRDDFLAAHLLARRCVARLTGDTEATTAVTIVQVCAECGADHGRPYVVGHPDVTVSWSHTRGHVGAAAAYDVVGIDVEAAVDRTRDVGALLRRTATADEAAAVLAAPDPDRAYLRMWVAKEALVKVGALSIGGFRRADVRSGSYAGFDLTVTETGDVVVGVARTAGR